MTDNLRNGIKVDWKNVKMARPKYDIRHLNEPYRKVYTS